ncbi:hypothetical protein [Sulfolobus islandicus rod-shaped virus 2]|uniref:Uncharacterized protein n=1 Tax=Sulfolobus islandicus rod-shaped virus 2 TaxID=157899 RepID=Q8V9P4_SIRV2|nr:hypothetical protein SIRV2gp24 [Sulfolobus islandicus rod-shaped virus 2]CAC87299.1 hypothetical protein [Sulfolobus islandicus rod-shaped virus 2]
MEIDLKNECRKYIIQFRNWLESRYSENIYFFNVFEDEEIILIQIKMNMKKKEYEKIGMSILKYLVHTFKYPNYIKVNWRYDRNMFKISVLCGNINMSETENKN